MDENKVGTVTIELTDYLELVKDSVTLQIVKQFFEKDKYISKADFMAIIGIKEEPDAEE